MPQNDLIKMELVGFKELEDCLRTMPQKVAKKHLDSAIREGLKIIKQSEQALAPKKTGKLISSIQIYKTRAGNRPPSTQTSWSVKPLKKKGGGFALILEYGAKPHIIQAKEKGGALRAFASGYRAWVYHPGIPAGKFAFMNPVWNTQIGNVIARVGNVLAENIFEETGQYHFQDRWVKTINI